MYAKKCDRCGECYKANELKIKVGYAEFTFMGLEMILYSVYYNFSYDLCDKCASELVKFLDPIPLDVKF